MADKQPTDRNKDRHKANHMVRIPADLFEELKALAASNHRPLAWEVSLALRNHLAQARGRKPKPPGEAKP